jgi:hypothetical protein
MKKAVWMILTAFGLFFHYGCSESDINIVKNGFFDDYPYNTIGKLLASKFDNGKWTAGQNTNGTKHVIFSGEISQAFHERLAAELEELLLQSAQLKTFAPAEDPMTQIIALQLLLATLHTAQNPALTVQNFASYSQSIVQAIAAYGKALGQTASADEKEKIKRQYYAAYNAQFRKVLDEHIFPAGSVMEFTWVISPDRDVFELASIAYDELSEFAIDHLITLICEE